MSALSRRHLMLASLAAAVLPARGQAFPTRPLRILVPFAPGGSTDLLARLVAKPLGERLGQPVVVENRPGAGGNIAADAVAKAAPDGHTLVMGSIGTHATNGLIYASMPYDAVRDFAPVTLVGAATLVLVVHPSLPARTVTEFVALLRAKPGEYSYASGGVAASQHLAGEMFKYATRTDMQHVPYKGSAGALQDLLSGRVPIMFADLPLVLQHIQGGGLRALGVADPEPSPTLPGVPAVAQAVPNYSASAWYGLFAPARTPEPVLARLQHEVAEITKLPEVRKTMLEMGARPSGLSGAQLRHFQESEIARWRDVVREAKIRME
jgi:tripartite-type tricarboxylate transporter receptor subunit TctC